MKRALFSQIRNDWRENIWLVIELFIVALVIWWLTLTLLRTFKDTRIPLGVDITHVYAAEFNCLDKEGEIIYEIDEEDPETQALLVRDIQGMLDRVRRLPMVEAAALGHNCIPYSYGYFGQQVAYAHKKDTVRLEVNRRMMTPEGLRVLGINAKDGRTPDQLREILEKGRLLVGECPAVEMYSKKWGMDIHDIINAELIGAYAGYKVGGLIQNIRRNDYEVLLMTNTLVKPIQENTPDILDASSLIIRVKPGKEKDFEEAMRSEPTLISPATVALTKLRPVANDKRIVSWRQEVNRRTMIAGIVFLLVIVLIGLLGTFWHRVYVRTSEIAIRKTFGASDIDILRRLSSEALLLSAIALLIALTVYFTCLDYIKSMFLYYIINFTTWKWDVALSWIITALIMGIMIMAGVGIPALRAMRIQPAIALKED